MKVSHELPLSLLKYSKKWNDYEYCLPHLLDQNEQYRIHFQKARLDHRFIIMDNGLFEGVEHTTEDLIDKMNMIHPDIFVVPDAWNDTDITFRNAKYWINTLKPQLPSETELMVVLQGKTMDDMLSMYLGCLDMGYRCFAFNHSSILYNDIFPHPNLQVSKMMGRILLISKMLSYKVLDKTAYHHLLGCSLPQEFAYYKGMDFIKSVDTSNPIIVGAQGERYENGRLMYKPSEKLEVYFEQDLESQIEDIKFNVQQFKKNIKY
jgi:hypothetical protein